MRNSFIIFNGNFGLKENKDQAACSMIFPAGLFEAYRQPERKLFNNVSVPSTSFLNPRFPFCGYRLFSNINPATHGSFASVSGLLPIVLSLRSGWHGRSISSGLRRV